MKKNGFITKLDQFVWDKACALLREWDDKGYSPISISVNVSRADIYNTDIADILLNTVHRYGVRPSRLHLEITESAYTEHPSQIIEVVANLRELGFVIEMDDFGSGYSSLNMLHQMPLDVLKLDMKFIQGETAKAESQGILQTIVELARRMKLSVVAEGVETREQLYRVAEAGCDYVQGFYFAKPMPSREFEVLLKEGQAAVLQENGEGIRPQLSVSPRPVRQILLVADEDPLYRSEVEKTFSEYFQVIQSENISSALAYTRQYKGQLAAVLLSVTLPELGWPGVLDECKDEISMWGVPVIVTGPPEQQTEDKALELGASDYACKPHMQGSILKRTLRAIRLTSFQKRESILQMEAHRDYTTGLLNRRGLEAALKMLTEEAAPFAFCLFDLDNLKQTNDTLGHAAGDRLIKEFSAILRSHVRNSDILARYGGDEYIVILKRIQSEKSVVKKADEICQALKQITIEQEIQASVSVGIVISDMKGGIDEVFKQADMALYRAKADNKGSFYVMEK